LSAEELNAGAAVHLSPQHFEAIDVPFDGAVAPTFPNGAFDRAEILPALIRCGRA
jgi:hypothetical protein